MQLPSISPRQLPGYISGSLSAGIQAHPLGAELPGSQAALIASMCCRLLGGNFKTNPTYLGNRSVVGHRFLYIKALRIILWSLIGATILEFVNLSPIYSPGSEPLPAQTWERYSDWSSDHPVKLLFNNLMQTVVHAKAEGIGASHTTPTLQELKALEQGAKRLATAGVQDGWGQVHRDKWRQNRPVECEDQFFKICATVTGLKLGAEERELVLPWLSRGSI